MTPATPRTILLAEDNRDDAFLTMRAMESAGITHHVHHCHNGQEVIDYLVKVIADRENQADVDLPDLILLDFKMPSLGGLEALGWIRRHEILQSLIVIALTSSSEERDVKAAYQLQINAYLVKPSSLAEMVELARCLRLFWLDQKHLIRPRFVFSTPFGLPLS